ncbi:hypothetical protein E2562_033270 [Oryza meyeriana var. granulata]|uniref:Uncharacterized protein n=1 Tax=Oryza meyeriana var. granulata TaxID=110450 RepID=A0A6G1CW15_9ORYZ|nr:hypothetical protein E2562_033270 [Oryza meyeriana var. granulata]
MAERHLADSTAQRHTIRGKFSRRLICITSRCRSPVVVERDEQHDGGWRGMAVTGGERRSQVTEYSLTVGLKPNGQEVVFNLQPERE